MVSDNSNRVGLVISSTDSIRVFLSGASNDTILSDELRRTSSDLLLQSEIPYAPLRALWMASDPSTRPDLIRLFPGTRFVFSSPKPREKVFIPNFQFRFLNSLHLLQLWLPFFVYPKFVLDETYRSIHFGKDIVYYVAFMHVDEILPDNFHLVDCVSGNCVDPLVCRVKNWRQGWKSWKI